MPHLRVMCPTVDAAERRRAADVPTAAVVEMSPRPGGPPRPGPAHSHPPTDVAVGGQLLSRRLPRAARIAEKLLDGR